MWQKKFKNADFGVCSYSGGSEHAASPSLFRGPTRESALVLPTDTKTFLYLWSYPTLGKRGEKIWKE